MKNMLRMIVALLAVGTVVSCDPVEDRNSLPAITLDASELNFSVTIDPNDPNKVIMTNLTEDVIPYWNFTNAAGDDLGHSNQQTTSTVLPFAGTYNFYFTAYTRGGAVTSQAVPITIQHNDDDYFEAPEWGYLTNGTEGRTWVLDMTSPMGWAGLDFPGPSGDNWNWFPDYAGNEWVMANKNWGSMTFNLDGNYNVSVTQTALTTNDQTTETGTFSLNLETNRLVFNGGTEMLHGGDYYPDSSNWINVHVLELTETSLRLAVVRDQDRAGQSPCQIMFHYKPAE